MVGIVTVLVVVTISIVVTNVGAVALVATGVSRDLAHFQARSAFTGVGYTTAEAETITGHTVRRRIILTLMLLGNAGIVSVIASLVLGFSDAGTPALARLGLLVGGLGLLWMLTSTDMFNRVITGLIERALRRWTDLEVRDYVELLELSGNYAVRDVQVNRGDWMADTPLRDLELTSEGVLVLAIRRSNGQFLGAPTPDTTIETGDTVLLYGRQGSLEQLTTRSHGPSGDADHARGVRRQHHVQAVEQAEDARARDEQMRGDQPPQRP